MSETALLCAVRDRIRSQLDYRDHECEIEYDEVPPTAVGEKYVVVMPGGWEAGPANNPGGGVLDEVHGVDVLVLIRSVRLPRDRRRNIFLDNLEGLNKRVRDVIAKIHFVYQVLNDANALIDSDVSTEKFVETLKFAGCDSRPREFSGGIFKSSQGEEVAGLGRTIRFRGARRIQYQTSQV